MTRAFTCLLGALVLGSFGSPHGKSGEGKLGDPAPPLKIQQWFQGIPVEKFEKGKVYVVEFWATWCGPCRESIPHLTELSKKFEGKATFIGVSVFENTDKGIVEAKQLPKVAKYVAQMGAKMAYTVAADTEKGDMGKSWMDAYGQEGIPTAFIVDQQSRVAFVSHPMDPQFEANLALVVAGKFDIDKARKESEASKALEAERDNRTTAVQQAMQARMPDFIKFAKAGDQDSIEKAILKIDQDNKNIGEGLVTPDVETRTMLILKAYNEEVYYAYVKKLSEGKYSKNASALNSLAWAILTDSKLKKPNLALALAIAQGGVTVSRGEDGEILDTLALAYFKNGDKARAIETENLAIAKTNDADLKGQMREQLERFKKG